jgi:mannose-6-phosphate isomerase-like protein (cupin superfamily)
MKHIKTGKVRGFFEVLAQTRSGQAAMMTLRPGQSTGEPENEHSRSEQWLFVISGSGTARVGKRTVALRKNSLLLIEKGEVHQVSNSGRGRLVTLNFYAPPAYTPAGEVRRAAE